MHDCYYAKISRKMFFSSGLLIKSSDASDCNG